jgi:hypothetical protein
LLPAPRPTHLPEGLPDRDTAAWIEIRLRAKPGEVGRSPIRHAGPDTVSGNHRRKTDRGGNLPPGHDPGHVGRHQLAGPGDRRIEAKALRSLGTTYAALGQAEEAIGFFEQCLPIARKTGDRRGEGNALGILSAACLLNG